MPLKEYVDSRFSTPDEISRFKSVQWIIGYILGMATPSMSYPRAKPYFLLTEVLV